MHHICKSGKRYKPQFLVRESPKCDYSSTFEWNCCRAEGKRQSVLPSGKVNFRVNSRNMKGATTCCIRSNSSQFPGHACRASLFLRIRDNFSLFQLSIQARVRLVQAKPRLRSDAAYLKSQFRSGFVGVAVLRGCGVISLTARVRCRPVWQLPSMKILVSMLPPRAQAVRWSAWVSGWWCDAR